jgi:hypothetical protein
MPNPTVSDVHVNQPLSNISIAYIQDETKFVAQRVFANVPVPKQSDVFYAYNRGDFNRNQAQKRAPGTESAGGGYRLTNNSSYLCDVIAYHKDIPDQIRDNSDAVLDPDREATIYVTQLLLIQREVSFATNFMTTGLWTNGISGSGSSQWSDYTNSDPITAIRLGMDTVEQLTGYRPNVLVMGRPVWSILADHPDIVDRVKYGQSGVGKPAMVTREAVAALLELDRIEVAAGIQNTGIEGATDSESWIIGKSALLAYVPPAPGLMTPAAGYTFSWTGYLGASAQGTRISKFRMEWLRSDRVEGEIAYSQKLISADLGYFFNTITA